ncbi:MAG: UDP-3-O-(3-hydroxymyristoyl)glucosamine N-acyltransferase [Verrucomicrobiales bacterium]
MTVSDLTASLDGTLLSGPPDRVFLGCQSLAEAEADDLSFFGNEKYLPALRTTRAGVVLVPDTVPASIVHLVPQAALVAVPNPSLAFSQVMARLAPPPPRFLPGIHATAVVDPSAAFDPTRVSIGPHAVIEAGVTIGAGTSVGAGSFLGEGVSVGAGCVLHPRVIVQRHCRLGDRVTLHPGVVIGADGFGFEQLADGRREKIPQVGTVVIEDDVEIGANSCVDRARFGQTLIGAGTKIDNLVQIAHNVRIGKNCVIAGQSGIAGSTRLHDNVTLAAQVGVAGHIEIASGVIVTAQSGVSKSLREPGIYMGDHADPMRRTLRIMAARQHLPELVQRVRALEKRKKPPPPSPNP